MMPNEREAGNGGETDRSQHPHPEGNRSGDDAPHASAASEAPYIAAVLLVLLALFASLFAPEHVQREDPMPAPTPPEEMALEGEEAAYFSVVNLALLGAGLVCLSFLAMRLHSPRPLIQPREAPPARWIWWDLVKVVIVYQALLILLLSLASPEPDGPGTLLLLWNMIAMLAAAGIAVRVAVVDRGSPPASLGLTTRQWPRFTVIGVVAFLAFWPIHVSVMALGTWIIQQFDIRLPPQDVVVMFAQADDALTLALLAGHAVIVAPIAEELFFRGLMIPLIERRARGWIAVLVSAFLFAAVHGNLRAFLPIFLLGLALGYVFSRTRSLIAPIAFHFTYNAVALVLIYMVRTMGG